MDSLTDLNKQMLLDRPELYDLIMTWGWRAWFDPFCCEWHQVALEQKLETLRYVLTKVSLRRLLEMYMENWGRSTKKQYVLADLPFALQRYNNNDPDLSIPLNEVFELFDQHGVQYNPDAYIVKLS